MAADGYAVWQVGRRILPGHIEARAAELHNGAAYPLDGRAEELARFANAPMGEVQERIGESEAFQRVFEGAEYRSAPRRRMEAYLALRLRGGGGHPIAALDELYQAWNGAAAPGPAEPAEAAGSVVPVVGNPVVGTAEAAADTAQAPRLRLLSGARVRNR